jgi:alkylhydroperoxidase family enzyme
MTHPRVRPRDPEEVAPEVRSIFEVFLKERGNIPNMFRTVGALPKHLTTMITHFRTVMNEGEVPPLLKELIAIRVSSINRCKY